VLQDWEKVFGPLAQLVEQLTLNQLVVGSIPTRPTIYLPRPVLVTGLFLYTRGELLAAVDGDGENTII
jgi:hypothetical protein